MTDLLPWDTCLEVRPEWTDANGHMNVAYYVLAFDHATDAFYDRLGLGWRILEEGRSLFTLAMNVDYLHEVFAGDGVRIVSRLLDCDTKRLHYFHEMFRERDGVLAATNEIVALHVGMAERTSEPFPGEVAARLATIKAHHARLPLPPQAGRVLGLVRR
jgi:acyl-CoA thioester hydrolase